MARPRKYDATTPATNAERQAAKRARDKAQWVEVARDAHHAHAARLDALQTAIHNAAGRGDQTAIACNSANAETMLELLAAVFENAAQKPRRLQRKRVKGFRLPANTVCVTRGTRFGNPFRVGVEATDNAHAVALFRDWLETEPEGRAMTEAAREKLAGKNLACYCKEGEPCHADVLLQIANTL